MPRTKVPTYSVRLKYYPKHTLSIVEGSEMPKLTKRKERRLVSLIRRLRLARNRENRESERRDAIRDLVLGYMDQMGIILRSILDTEADPPLRTLIGFNEAEPTPEQVRAALGEERDPRYDSIIDKSTVREVILEVRIPWKGPEKFERALRALKEVVAAKNGTLDYNQSGAVERRVNAGRLEFFCHETGLPFPEEPFKGEAFIRFYSDPVKKS